jgi:hypothetical protein
MDAVTAMNEQIAQFPIWLQHWLTWMQIVLIVLPFLFIKHREAQVLIAAQVLNFAVGGVVYAMEENQITKLFGLGHIFWAGAYGYFLYRIWTRKADIQSRPYFRAWLYTAIITLTISLPFDAYDLAKYAGGMRQPMVEYYQGS